MGLRTDARLDLNYILLDAAALRDVTALQFVSTLWAAAVCSVSTVGSINQLKDRIQDSSQSNPE